MEPGWLLLLASLSAAPNLFRSVLLDDPDPEGARCLDGSPPRIWVHPAPHNSVNSTRWSWHFQGGGWCESESACAERAFDPQKCMLGSSRIDCFNKHACNVKPFTPEMDLIDLPAVNGARWGGGLLNNSAETNPLAHDWNKVVMMYCDGGSYSGNNATPTSVFYPTGSAKRREIVYRGYRNLKFALQVLSEDFNMSAATDVLVSGDSAGGLAAYWHADRIQAALPKAFVATVPDSGFFIGDKTKPAWPASLQWIATAMNSTEGLDASCVRAAAASGHKPSMACTLPEDVARYISVPLFTMNSKYDSAMISISSTGGAASVADINALAERLVAKVNQSVLAGRALNGAFITACHEHCGQWAQGQISIINGYNASDFNATIGGVTAPIAVDRWYEANRAAWSGQLLLPQNTHDFVHIASAVYPCSNCCNGGDGP